MFSGSIFHMKWLPVMLNRPLYHIYPTPPRFTCHNVFFKVVHTSSFSSSLSMTGAFFILSQLPSWRCPHALVHSSSCLLQVHLRVLHPSKQLQWIIWISSSGVGLLSVITGTSLSPSTFHPHSDGAITTSHPLHNLIVSPQRMKSTGRGGWRVSFWRDEHLCPCNFFVEHIISNRSQWVLLISIDQCYYCLRTIGFQNILRLLWSRDCFWPVFHCLFSFEDSLEPQLLSNPEHPGHRITSCKGMQKQLVIANCFTKHLFENLDHRRRISPCQCGNRVHYIWKHLYETAREQKDLCLLQ